MRILTSNQNDPFKRPPDEKLNQLKKFYDFAVQHQDKYKNAPKVISTFIWLKVNEKQVKDVFNRDFKEWGHGDSKEESPRQILIGDTGLLLQVIHYADFDDFRKKLNQALNNLDIGIQWGNHNNRLIELLEVLGEASRMEWYANNIYFYVKLQKLKGKFSTLDLTHASSTFPYYFRSQFLTQAGTNPKEILSIINKIGITAPALKGIQNFLTIEAIKMASLAFALVRRWDLILALSNDLSKFNFDLLDPLTGKTVLHLLVESAIEEKPDTNDPKAESKSDSMPIMLIQKISCRTDPVCMDNRGWSPLSLAIKNDRWDIVKILIKSQYEAWIREGLSEEWNVTIYSFYSEISYYLSAMAQLAQLNEWQAFEDSLKFGIKKSEIDLDSEDESEEGNGISFKLLNMRERDVIRCNLFEILIAYGKITLAIKLLSKLGEGLNGAYLYSLIKFGRNTEADTFLLENKKFDTNSFIYELCTLKRWNDVITILNNPAMPMSMLWFSEESRFFNYFMESILEAPNSKRILLILKKITKNINPKPDLSSGGVANRALFERIIKELKRTVF